MNFLNHFSRILNRWLARRPWRIFILCLPALLAILATVTVAAIVLRRPSSELYQRYDRLAQHSLARQQFETARVACLRGLAFAKNERNRAPWVFHLALALDGLGQKQDAAALMAEAAPLDPPGSGYVEAHLVVAENLLSTTNLVATTVRLADLKATNQVAQTLRLAERHLLSALKLDSNSVPVNEALGRFYINTHQLAKARERLTKIYAAKPDNALLLAIIADQQNDAPAAAQWADRAVTAIEQNILNSAPQYNPADRLALVQALLIKDKYTAAPGAHPNAVLNSQALQDSPGLWFGIVRLLVADGKFEPALQTLENLERQSAVGTNPVYHAAVAQVCALWANHLPANQTESPALRLHLIQKGLTNAPDNQLLKWLLVQAAQATDEAAPAAKTLLDQCMAPATGTAAAEWHFLLAREASVRGDLAAKRRQLQAAYELAPQDPQIKNNLALSELTSANRDDWEQALKLSQSVVAQFPDVAEFRGTRGRILARLGRPREALPDLEYAVSRVADATEDRQALTKVYAALGRVHQDTPSDQLGRVRELMSQNKYAAAVDTLDQAMLVSTNPAYAATLADICATWVESLPLSQHAERLRLIQKGLAQAPQHQKLRALLLQAAQAANDSAPTAQKLLTQLVAGATGQAAVEWHLLLGRDARLRGDLPTARNHLQTAFAAAPGNTQIQIELAMVFAAGDQADLDRGLKLIQPVLDQFPDNSEFRNTRGQILARLGRNKEAAADLAFAAPRLGNPADSVQARLLLAKIYDALGQPKLAREQRLLAGQPR